MKKFPHEFQLDQKDCGPACIKIVAKYYKKYFSLQYLRDLCGLSKAGITFYDMSEAFEKIGFKTVCVKLSWEEFLDFPLPCVVHWKNSHFIIVYKIDKKYVFVSDPAKELIKYTISEFKNGWLGKEEKWAVLGVEPVANFIDSTKESLSRKIKSLNSFLDYFIPYRKSFLNLFVIMLIVTLLQAVLPFISKAVIDVGIQTGDIEFINLVLIANIVLILAILLSNLVRDWILLHITTRVNISLISDYLIKLMKLPVTFFESKLIGDILQRANDHERIRSFFMNNSLNFIFSVFTIIGFGIILFIFSPILFLIFIIGNLLFVLWVLTFLKYRKKIDWEYFDLNSKNQSYWIETIKSIQDIKINNYEKQKRWKWENIQAKLYHVNQRVLGINNAQNLGAQFINQLTNLFITFYSAKAVIQGQITFGVMVSTQFIIGMLNGPVSQFILFIQAAQNAKISFLRLNEIHEMQDEEETTISNSIQLPENRSLSLKNITFQYNRNAELVLKNINISIPEGKVTAIVGESGSGKTTLLKLILRLYNPLYGQIDIGNMNIKNIGLRQWRDNCGAVMQDGVIFNETILNNIVLEDERINYDNLKKAVSAANIIKEIEAMPQGYQTLIGENGRGISGGQKQRILIARALYKDPDFLFFDEATNSLDVENEQKITSALDDIFKNKTVIVVAHRLSTIRTADQIVVMKDGFVVEVGNHETLMEKENGFYQKLVKIQMGESING